MILWLRFARKSRDYIKLALGREPSPFGGDAAEDRVAALEEAQRYLRMALDELRLEKKRFEEKREELALLKKEDE